MKFKQIAVLSLIISSIYAGSALAAAQEPLMIESQGSFAAGGTVYTAPGSFNPEDGFTNLGGGKNGNTGQTLHGDHLTASYQIPVNARKLPLVFLHGAGQSARTWDTTPDGREGFRTVFARRGYSVYVVDQPRRGQSGRSTEDGMVKAQPDEQFWFGQFRVGQWPEYYPGVQFSKDKEALNQYFRQMTPNVSSYDANINSDALSALFDKTGPGILITHSQGGGNGWLTGMKNSNVKAIISYEPGSQFVFPEAEMPEPLPSKLDTLTGYPVSLDEFKKLTKIPIIIYYGDYIGTEPGGYYAQDAWRIRLEMARKWVAVVNKYGGDAKVVHLPEIGIKGNTHFPFSDLNSLQIADLMENWLHEKGLDKR